MNDARFFDLAVKVIAGHAEDSDRAELDGRLAREPELRQEFARLESEAGLAKHALPLVAACAASTGEFPAYARERLQTVVRHTFGRPESTAKEPSRGLLWDWRWVLGLAAATAVVMLVALPIFRAPNAPVIQLAMLDIAGGTRGAATNELATFQGTWKGSPVQSFSSVSELQAWEKDWPDGDGRPAAKIIYDPAAGEVRVSGHSQRKVFQRTFPLEKDMATTLQQANAFVLEQTKK